MRVNLLGEKRKKKSGTSFGMMRLVTTILIVLLIVVAGYMIFMQRSELRALRDEEAAIDEQIEHYEPEARRYSQLTERRDELEGILPEPVIQQPWGEVLLQVGYLIPGNTMVNHIRIEEKDVTIEGHARSDQEVINLLINLEEAPVFDFVGLNNIQHGEEVNFTIDATIETGG